MARVSAYYTTTTDDYAEACAEAEAHLLAHCAATKQQVGLALFDPVEPWDEDEDDGKRTHQCCLYANGVVDLDALALLGFDFEAGSEG